MKTETVNLKNGNYLEIHLDDHGGIESPREWDNLSKMVCFHSRYNLGDDHDVSLDDYHSWGDMIEDNVSDNDLLMPLYLYDHSGITISTSPFSCRWDSGQVGFVYIAEKDIIENWGDNSAKSRLAAMKCLQSEVNTYDQYLRGEVYGYILKDFDGTEIDSCWGFYGHDYYNNGIFDNAGIKAEEVA